MNARPRVLVTLEGYAVEGGFDRPFEPATCYAPTIALGRHAGPGRADNLWRDYEAVLAFVPGLGFDGIRLTVEWARIEPREGRVDQQALDRYGEVVRYARGLGLDVTLALVDSAWPAWLGPEAWLLPWVRPHVVGHARLVVSSFASDLTGVVAFTRPGELVTGGYLRASAPPWRTRAVKEADFAAAQLEAINADLRADDVVGPRLVAKSAETTLDIAAEDLAQAKATLDVDEYYVRSLLRGSGPTALAMGFLVHRGDEWRVNAPEDLLSALH
jgi:beta-glucosidase/6-phospho-beta-glucosidase/beta-galactosidase